MEYWNGGKDCYEFKEQGKRLKDKGLRLEAKKTSRFKVKGQRLTVGRSRQGARGERLLLSTKNFVEKTIFI
jgi:hypothetical protein